MLILVEHYIFLVLDILVTWCVRVCVCVSHSVISDQASLVCGLLQARILQWVAIFFSRDSSRPWKRTQVSCTAGRSFTIWTPGKPTWCMTCAESLPSAGQPTWSQWRSNPARWSGRSWPKSLVCRPLGLLVLLDPSLGWDPQRGCCASSDLYLRGYTFWKEEERLRDLIDLVLHIF